MANLKTGLGASITFVTSNFVAKLLELTPPEETREALETTTYDETNGFATYINDDIIEGGEVGMRVRYDATVTPPSQTEVEEIQLGYPGAVGYRAFQGFVTKWAPKLPLKGALAEAEVTIKVASKPVFNPGGSGS